MLRSGGDVTRQCSRPKKKLGVRNRRSAAFTWMQIDMNSTMTSLLTHLIFILSVPLVVACASQTVELGTEVSEHSGKATEYAFTAIQAIEMKQRIRCTHLGGGVFRMTDRGPDGKFGTDDDIDMGMVQSTSNGIPVSPCPDVHAPAISGIFRSNGVVILKDEQGNQYFGRWKKPQ